jgi:hypothetical protein
MTPLGIHLTLLIGPTVPVPAPAWLMENLQSVQVNHSDEGQSGFQITFKTGRGGPMGVRDYPVLATPLLRAFSRVVITVTLDARPRVLMDGFITNAQLSASSQPGSSTVTLTGEDLSVMMDMEERTFPYPNQADSTVVQQILGRYAAYGLGFQVQGTPPPKPLTEKLPAQHGTDLAHIRELAGQHGFVFYLTPGPIPMTSMAYWGPPVRSTRPQRALSVNLGSATNVETIHFQNDHRAPAMVFGKMFEPKTRQTLVVQTLFSTRVPLSSQPALTSHQPYVRKVLPESSQDQNFAEVMSRAQARTDTSTDNVVTASGELDVSRYGDLLEPRGLVGLRGAGYSHDGLYYVKSVSHALRKGEYKQSFNLAREGIGALAPMVIP